MPSQVCLVDYETGWVSPFAALNIMLVWYGINYQPHDTNFERLLAPYRFKITATSVCSTMGEVVSFLWVSSANAIQAIQHTDRAEEIALLQRQAARQEHREAKQK
jgi:hypothetical protein